MQLLEVSLSPYDSLNSIMKMLVHGIFNIADLIKEHDVVLKGPFNYPARDEAGIPREW